MAEEALEMSCGMKPEWARWSVHPGRETEETIEANLMFAVRPQNIYPTPKAIKNESYCCTAAQKIPTKMPFNVANGYRKNEIAQNAKNASNVVSTNT